MPPWLVASLTPMAFASLMVHPYVWVFWWAFVGCVAALIQWADSEEGLS